jgi:hypothetical protein
MSSTSMELKTFVSQSIKDIFDGVIEAQSMLKIRMVK